MLETILRMLDNDSVQVEAIKKIKVCLAVGRWSLTFLLLTLGVELRERAFYTKTQLKFAAVKSKLDKLHFL